MFYKACFIVWFAFKILPFQQTREPKWMSWWNYKKQNFRMVFILLHTWLLLVLWVMMWGTDQSKKVCFCSFNWFFKCKQTNWMDCFKGKKVFFVLLEDEAELQHMGSRLAKPAVHARVAFPLAPSQYVMFRNAPFLSKCKLIFSILAQKVIQWFEVFFNLTIDYLYFLKHIWGLKTCGLGLHNYGKIFLWCEQWHYNFHVLCEQFMISTAS